MFRTLVAYGSDICPDWLFFFSCIQNTCRVVMAQRTTEFSTVSSVEHWSAKSGDLRFNFKSWRKTRILLRLDLPLATSIYFLFPFPLSKSLKNCYFGNFSIKNLLGQNISCDIGQGGKVDWNQYKKCMHVVETNLAPYRYLFFCFISFISKSFNVSLLSNRPASYSRHIWKPTRAEA